MSPLPVVVGISGASGAQYGIRTISAVQECGYSVHLVVSGAAAKTIAVETGRDAAEVEKTADVWYAEDDIAAAVASGSYQTKGMIVAPCSMKTLSGIANSYAENLLVRAADVTLKEGRSLVLLVRETPLHLGHLRLMAHAAEIGAVIFPPVPAFYSRPQTVADIVDTTVGRVLARLGVENDLYARWEG